MQTPHALNDENALAALDNKVQEIFDSPKPNFQGERGIVVPGGGLKYFPCLWVCINMLRHHGCTLPVQVWHLGPEEVPEEIKGLLDPLDVEFVDAHEVRKQHPARILHGWELKPYAMLHSPFQEVLLLDADNVAVRDPSYLFETKQFQETGSVFWPDYGRLARDRAIWDLTGVTYQDEPEFETGQILVDKSRCWHELQLAMWFNEHSDYWYQHIHGDKDTFHMAWRKLDAEYAMPRRPIFALQATMCQHDFEDKRVFQHRNMAKWVPRKDENPHIPGFELEDLCLNWIEQLHGHHIEKRLLGVDQPTTEAIELLGDRHAIYTRVGFETRAIKFRGDGRIDGAGGKEAYWNLTGTNGDRKLTVYGDDGKTTATLAHDPDNHTVWRGAWHEFERMPIELRIKPAAESGSIAEDYSQWGEQHFILDFFHGKTDGYFLDIGAGDGVRDSNTRALFELGWSGTLVEPVPEEFWRLEDNYANAEHIQLINAAVSEQTGFTKMWVAQPRPDGFKDNRHTLVEAFAEQARGHDSPATYQEREVRTIAVGILARHLPTDQIDFLSVDAEGLDRMIVGQLLANGLRPKLILMECDDAGDSLGTAEIEAVPYALLYRNKANAAWGLIG